MNPLENPATAATANSLLFFLNGGLSSETGMSVNIEKALGIPAVWAATNFLSGTIAGLPLNIYKKTKDGREKQSGQLSRLLHDAPNAEMSSFEWRKYTFERVFTEGRSYTLIDRNRRGGIVDLWPLDADQVTPKRKNGKKYYEFAEHHDDKRRKPTITTYEASDIIDIPFMLKSDGISHYSPIYTNKETIALGIAATQYGSRFFANGGVPPFVLTGPFQSAGALKRSSEDLRQAIQSASAERRLALSLPEGHEIHPLGADPEKSQLVALKKYLNEEIARIYSLPVLFIQDLSKGTYANTEQQDLHLVKHTIKRWVEQVEQELNLKLFGRNNTRFYVEFNLDGLLRGDFKTRMEGYSKAVQNALMTPNEIRQKENLAAKDAADDLLIQGATVPLGSQEKEELKDDAEQDEATDAWNPQWWTAGDGWKW